MKNQTTKQHLTNKDMDTLKEELLRKLASKEELKKLATKEELKKLATKEELKKLATKDELHQVENKLIKEIIKIKTEIATLETKADAEKRFNLIMQAIDGLAAKIDSYNTEKAAVDHSLKRHDTQIEDHEHRITKLESVV